MIITELYIAIAVGMALSLLLEEFTGISAGGIIVPGYLALAFGQPLTALMIYVIALLTYLIVNYVLPHIVILFGKRKFVATLMIALVLKLAFDFLYPLVPFDSLEYRGIGIVVPGLLASSFSKQSIKITIPASLAVSLVVFGVIQLVYMF